MKNLLVVVCTLSLLVALAVSFQMVKTNAYDKNIVVKLAAGLRRAYAFYVQSENVVEIDPTRLKLDVSPEFGHLPGADIARTIVRTARDPVRVGSEVVVCVAVYDDRVFVGIRGNGEAKLLSKLEFDTWMDENRH